MGCKVSEQVVSIAAVIRNFKGELMGVKAQKFRWSGSVALAELEAIRFGMDFCILLISRASIFSLILSLRL